MPGAAIYERSQLYLHGCIPVWQPGKELNMAWQVITHFYTNGTVKAYMNPVPYKLENKKSGGIPFDEYIDYFDNEEEAQEHYDDALIQNKLVRF